MLDLSQQLTSKATASVLYQTTYEGTGCHWKM